MGDVWGNGMASVSVAVNALNNNAGRPDSLKAGVPPYFTSLKPFAGLFAAGMPWLMYHKLGPRPGGVRLKGLYVSRALFERQLAELRRAGFTTPVYGPPP